LRRLRARCARQSCSSQALLTSLAWRRWSGSVTGELQAHGGLLQFRDASTGDNAVLDTIQIRSSTARRAMLGGLFTCATAYASATLAHEQCQDLTFVALPARSASVPIGAYNSSQPGQRAASGTSGPVVARYLVPARATRKRPRSCGVGGTPCLTVKLRQQAGCAE
jgi:hypothetical protein